MRNGLISAPIHTNSDQDFPVIQYADDTILVMQANAAQLHQLKNLLMYFSTFIGLRVNYEKSVIVPINTTMIRCWNWLILWVAKLDLFPSHAWVYLSVCPSQRLRILCPSCKELKEDWLVVHPCYLMERNWFW